MYWHFSIFAKVSFKFCVPGSVVLQIVKLKIQLIFYLGKKTKKINSLERVYKGLTCF
jgi:hypothetical protein